MIRPFTVAGAAVLCAVWTAPAAAQTLGQGADTDVPWLRLSAALLLCLGLAVGAAVALHRRLNGGAGLPDLDLKALSAKLSGAAPGTRGRLPRLTDIETRRLSTHATVSVFKCDGRSFMVATSPQGQLVLVSLDDAEEPHP